MRGSCRGATEGASTVYAEMAPSGPLGHLPRIAGEELAQHSTRFTDRPTARPPIEVSL